MHIYHDQRTMHSDVCTMIWNATNWNWCNCLISLQNTATTFQLRALSILHHTYIPACQVFMSFFFVISLFLLLSPPPPLLMYGCVCVCCVAWWTMTSLWFTHFESCDFFHDYTFTLKCRFYNEYNTHIRVHTWINDRSVFDRFSHAYFTQCQTIPAELFSFIKCVYVCLLNLNWFSRDQHNVVSSSRRKPLKQH